MADSAATPAVAPAAAVKGAGGRKTDNPRNNRKSRVPRAGSALSSRLIQDAVLASRNGGGGDVQVELKPDGTQKITIAVKQSRDCEPPLVTETRNLRLQDVAAQRTRQQRWIDWIDQQPRDASPAKKPAPERAKTRKRREKRQADRITKRQNEEWLAELSSWAPYDTWLTELSTQLEELDSETLPASVPEPTAQTAPKEYHEAMEVWEADTENGLTELRATVDKFSAYTLRISGPGYSDLIERTANLRVGHPVPVKATPGTVGGMLSDEQLGFVFVLTLGLSKPHFEERFRLVSEALTATWRNSTTTTCTKPSSDMSAAAAGLMSQDEMAVDGGK